MLSCPPDGMDGRTDATAGAQGGQRRDERGDAPRWCSDSVDDLGPHGTAPNDERPGLWHAPAMSTPFDLAALDAACDEVRAAAAVLLTHTANLATAAVRSQGVGEA